MIGNDSGGSEFVEFGRNFVPKTWCIFLFGSVGELVQVPVVTGCRERLKQADNRVKVGRVSGG